MQTDRITVLRALLDYEGTLYDMDIERLLDCAEALALIMEDPDARAALTPTQHDEGMAALARLNGERIE